MENWYLLTPQTRPNITGGFENDSYLNYKDDSFSELLQTDIASTVILCNSDLSIQSEIRCVIQGNSAETQIKSLERIGLFNPGIVKSGMYIFFENVYWLVTGYPGNNGIFEKATLVLCQYKLRWQNTNGEIIERWCNITSASKYDVGKTGNNILLLSSNNYSILLPDDDEVLFLDDKRVFIDKKNNPEKVFKLTRSDDVLYEYGTHGAIIGFIADKTEFNPSKDNQELRICDYFEKAEKPDDTEDKKEILSQIRYKFKTVFIGRKSTFTASFKDSDGNKIDKVPTWSITSDFTDSIIIEETGSEIAIMIKDNSLNGKSFNLSLESEDGTSTTSSITVDVESLV